MRENYNSFNPPKKRPIKQPNTPRLFQPSGISIPQQNNTNLKQSFILQIPREDMLKAVQIYGWRQKTSLPIIKTIGFSITPDPRFGDRKQWVGGDTSKVVPPFRTSEERSLSWWVSEYMQLHPQIRQFQVEVKVEELRCRLWEVQSLPFSQVVLLLKQAVTGFEVLIDIFGVFEPEEGMLAVNVRDQWKVWINVDFIANHKKEGMLGEREFIYKILVMCQKHCTPSNLSKNFFLRCKEYTYSQDCTFIKILEKISQFVSAHKIFNVNKVVLPRSQQTRAEELSRKGEPQPEKISPIRQNLKKLTNPSYFTPTSKPFQKPQLIRSGVYHQQYKSQTNLNRLKYCSSQFIGIQSQSCQLQDNYQRGNVTMNYSNYPNHITPNRGVVRSPKASFTQPHEAWKFRSLNIGEPISSQGQSNVQINYNKFKGQNEGFSKIHNPQELMIKISQSTLNHSPSKHRHEIKFMTNQQIKPPSNSGQNIQSRRVNTRKYSQQILKVKCLDLLKQRKFHGSNIYQNDPEMRVMVNVKTKKKTQLQSQLYQNREPQSPVTCTLKTYDSSSPGFQVSSPYNSSSTNQLQKSGEVQRISQYKHLKQNDLGGVRTKNNQSLINNCGMNKPHLDGLAQRKDKNMAISYQFRNRNQPNTSSQQSQSSDRKNALIDNNRWTKKLSGLFSDDASIRQLKESVKFKTKEEQIYQKEYLKDVKLEMLQKFGRQVKYMVEEDEDEVSHSPRRNYMTRHGQYKSMQLIEQQMEEAKSYLQQQGKEDQELPVQIRSRHQTVQIGSVCERDTISKQEQKQCLSEYSSSQSEGQGGFNFETEMYVLSPGRK